MYEEKRLGVELSVSQGDWLEHCDIEEDVTYICLGTEARTGLRKMRFILKRRMLKICR